MLLNWIMTELFMEQGSMMAKKQSGTELKLNLILKITGKPKISLDSSKQTFHLFIPACVYLLLYHRGDDLKTR